jgi:hypothetical protein
VSVPAAGTLLAPGTAVVAVSVLVGWLQAANKLANAIDVSIVYACFIRNT